MCLERSPSTYCKLISLVLDRRNISKFIVLILVLTDSDGIEQLLAVEYLRIYKICGLRIFFFTPKILIILLILSKKEGDFISYPVSDLSRWY